MNQALLYSKYNGLQKNDADYVLENYLRLVKWNPEGGDAVLDLGCGSGDVTTKMLLPKLPKNYRKLVGADLSEEMINFARSQNGHLPKVSFIPIDIGSKEGFVDLEGEFDHLFSFYCLHWIQNQRQAVQNMYQLLRPGGDMLLTFLASNPIFHIYENLSANVKWTEYMKNNKKYISPYQNSKQPEKDFEDYLTEAGFSVHLSKVVERKYVYPNVGNLRKSVIAINPFLGNIPEDLHNDYLTDFLREVRKLNYIQQSENNNDEKVRVPYKLLIAFASKPR